MSKRAKRKLPRKSSPSKPASLNLKEWAEVYDRIEYLDEPIPSCDARRLLRASIDKGFLAAFHDTYDDFVAALDEHPKRSPILSEIIAIWFLTECESELEARERDIERPISGTAA